MGVAWNFRKIIWISKLGEKGKRYGSASSKGECRGAVSEATSAMMAKRKNSSRREKTKKDFNAQKNGELTVERLILMGQKSRGTPERDRTHELRKGKKKFRELVGRISKRFFIIGARLRLVGARFISTGG